MDGGSTDNSVEIIKKYDQLLKDNKWPVKCKGIKYHWLNKKDNGQADAIEKGFAIAQGDIGAWLNSDDTYYSTRVFDTVATCFMAEDIDLLIGNGIVIDKKGKFLYDYQTKRIDLKELLFLDYHILQPAAFLKLSYYKENSFNKKLIYCFDVEFFIRLLANGIKYKKVEDKFSCFRVYPEIKTMSGQREKVREFLLIGKQYSNAKHLMFISFVYKHLTEFSIKYQRYFIVRLFFHYIRNFVYWLVVGTWGRK